MKIIDIFKKVSEKKLFFAIILLAAITRFLNITKSSIWHDEGYTVLMVKQGIIDITKTTAIDVHPPFYYYSLRLWTYIFGFSELAIRSMSAAFGIGAVIILYFLVKKIFDSKTALLAMLFAALSPYMIRYSQEARMYGVEGFWTILATYFFFLALNNIKNKDSFFAKNKYWIFYILSMAGAIYTHYYAFFLIPVHWIYVILRSIGTKEKPILAKEWWLSNIGIALLFAPWVPTVIKQFTKVQGGFWIPPVNLRTIPETILGAFTYNVPDYKNYVYLSTFGFLFGVTAWIITKNKEKWREIVFFLFYSLVPMTIVFVVSMKQPVYQTRYFVFAMSGLYVLTALFIETFKQKYIKIIMAILVSAILLGGIGSVYFTATHRMKNAAEIINSSFREGDGLAVTELYVYLDFDYYNKTGQRAKLIDSGDIRNNNEMAFIYPYRDDLVRKSWEDVETQSGIVWVVGKTNMESYKKIPANWLLLSDRQFGYTEIRKYQK